MKKAYLVRGLWSSFPPKPRHFLISLEANGYYRLGFRFMIEPNYTSGLFKGFVNDGSFG